MVREVVFAPHYDFFVSWTRRLRRHNMSSFHLHHKYEIYYQCEGTRRFYIDDSVYNISPGGIVLIRPNEVHKSVNIDDNPHERYMLNFSEQYLQKLFQTFEGVDFLACFHGRIHVLNAPPQQHTRIGYLMKQLWELDGKNRSEDEALRKMRLAEMLILLKEIAQECQPQTPSQLNKTVEQVQTYIHKHYTQPLTLSGIAAEFYVSPAYLSRLFKKHLSLSFIEYVNSVRTAAARKMLEQTDKKISVVAEECGFSTTAHFSRLFKEYTGMPPQKYRKFYHQ